MSIHTDKTLSLLLICTILITSVLSIPIKAVIGHRIIGGMIFTGLELSLYCLLFARLTLKGRFTYHHFDLPIILYIFYGLFLLLWSFANNNSPYYILQGFRLHFLPAILYFATKNNVYHDLRAFIKVKRFLFLIIMVVLFELYVQYLGLKLLGFNIERLPWVAMIQEARDIPYYTGRTVPRVIGMFAYSHPTGLICVLGFLKFFLEYRITMRKIYKFLSFLCVIGVFFAGSRTSFFSLLFVMIYIAAKDSRSKKVFVVYLAVVGLGLIASGIFTHHPAHSWHYGYTHYSNIMAFFLRTSSELNLLPFPGGSSLKNIIYLIFGTGFGYIHDLSTRYSAFTIYALDISLLVYVFQYGLIFLFLLSWLFIQIFRVKSFEKNILFYKASLIPFFFSLGHYAEMYTVGLTEIFFTIYALTVSCILRSKYQTHRQLIARA